MLQKSVIIASPSSRARLMVTVSIRCGGVTLYLSGLLPVFPVHSIKVCPVESVETENFEGQ